MAKGMAMPAFEPVPATQRIAARESGVRPRVSRSAGLDDTVDDLSPCVEAPAGLRFAVDISDLYTEDRACLTVDVHSQPAAAAARIWLLLGAVTCVGIGATLALLTLM